MVKKCIYCKSEISDDSVLDVCRRCGIGVWGEKMFNTIVKNMEEANEKGDLEFTRIQKTATAVTEDNSLI